MVHLQLQRRKWVDFFAWLLGDTQSQQAILPNVHDCSHSFKISASPLSPCMTFHPHHRNQWALSLIAPHNDPLFESRVIEGAGRRNNFILQLVCRAAHWRHKVTITRWNFIFYYLVKSATVCVVSRLFEAVCHFYKLNFVFKHIVETVTML